MGNKQTETIIKPMGWSWSALLIGTVVFCVAIIGWAFWIGLSSSTAEEQHLCETTPIIADYLAANEGSTVYPSKGHWCTVTPAVGPQLRFPSNK